MGTSGPQRGLTGRGGGGEGGVSCERGGGPKDVASVSRNRSGDTGGFEGGEKNTAPRIVMRSAVTGEGITPLHDLRHSKVAALLGSGRRANQDQKAKEKKRKEKLIDGTLTQCLWRCTTYIVCPH